MANRYANLVGANKIKDEWQKINAGFDAVQEDIDNLPVGLYRNAIINGGFDIWQRGTSFNANGYTADRWIVHFGDGGAGTVTRQSFTPGQTDVPGEPQYYIRISQTTPASSGHAVLFQLIEDVRTLAGQTVTLSFYARVGSGTKAIATRAQQVFGSGGSDNVETAGKVHTITTSWQRFTQTFAVPSISGKTIGNNSYLNIRLLEESNFSTFSLDIACVQLNIGDVALPFQPRSFAEELALCMRYYERFDGSSGVGQRYFNNGSSAGEVVVNNLFRVVKRITPTVSIAYDISDGSTNSGTPENVTKDGWSKGFYPIPAGGFVDIQSWYADAEF